MPRKFKGGENLKSAESRQRKEEQATAEKDKKEKAIEDAYWEDDDKLINRKLQKKEEKTNKKLEDIQKREERKLLEEQENKELQSKSAPPTVTKVTAFSIQKRKEVDLHKKASESQVDSDQSHLDQTLEENLNRSNIEIVSASGIDDAVSALSLDGEKGTDVNPEKRMAAAFRAFEESRLPKLKKENPTMRLSQIKQMVRREWQKSPQNPINIRRMTQQ